GGIPVVSAGRARRSGFARSFQFPSEQKYRTLYSSAPNGDRQNFFGPVIFSTPTNFVLKAKDVARSSGTLDVTVEGLSFRDHRIAVALNGRPVGTITLTSTANASRRFKLPNGVLRAGANSMTLAS